MKCALKILKEDYWNSKAATCNEDHLCRVTMHTGANDRWKWCCEGRHPKDAAVRIGWSSLSISKLQGRWDPTTGRIVWSSAFQPGQLGLFCCSKPSLRMYDEPSPKRFFRRTSRSPKALQSNFVTNSWKNSYWNSIDFPAISGTMSKTSIFSCQKTVENNWNIMKHHNMAPLNPSMVAPAQVTTPGMGHATACNEPPKDFVERRGEEEKRRRETWKTWKTWKPQILYDWRMNGWRLDQVEKLKKRLRNLSFYSFFEKIYNCDLFVKSKSIKLNLFQILSVFLDLTLICIPSFHPSGLLLWRVWKTRPPCLAVVKQKTSPTVPESHRRTSVVQWLKGGVSWKEESWNAQQPVREY